MSNKQRDGVEVYFCPNSEVGRGVHPSSACISDNPREKDPRVNPSAAVLAVCWQNGLCQYYCWP